MKHQAMCIPCSARWGPSVDNRAAAVRLVSGGTTAMSLGYLTQQLDVTSDALQDSFARQAWLSRQQLQAIYARLAIFARKQQLHPYLARLVPARMNRGLTLASFARPDHIVCKPQ